MHDCAYVRLLNSVQRNSLLIFFHKRSILDFSEAKGPSGFEDEVLTVARKYISDIADVREDCLRNLYMYRRKNTGNKPVFMLDAHSDEVGFMVHSIKPCGTLRFVPLGGWNVALCPGPGTAARSGRTELRP